jgi:hypothetical protein
VEPYLPSDGSDSYDERQVRYIDHVEEKLGELKCQGRYCCEDKTAVDSIEGVLEREVEKYLACKELLQADSVEEAIAVLPRRGLQNNGPCRHDLACEAYSLVRWDFGRPFHCRS